MKSIEESIDNLDKTIANWKHPTVWEAANHRMLKRLKQERTRLEKSVSQIQHRQKRQAIRDRRHEPRTKRMG